MTCPKCGTALADGAAACAKCGLVTTAMAAFRAKRDDTAPPNMRAAWDAAVAAWDEPAKHDAIVTVAAQTDSFPWVVSQYRDRATAQPDDPIAPKQIERLRKAAEVTMYATAAQRPDKTASPYRNVVAAVIVLVVAVAVGLGFAKYVQSRRGTPAPTWPKSTSPSAS